jgi:uncharacterized membrane protein YkvA (DUF1232 family)
LPRPGRFLIVREKEAPMLAYSWGGFNDDDNDDEAFPSGAAANDNVVAGIDAVTPEDEAAVRAGFWAKLADARPRLGRLGKARDLAKNAVLLFEMLVDPGFKVPWRTAAGIIFALAYFISSFDLIPDAVPVLGFFDDALVVAEVVYMFSADIRRYEETRRERAARRERRAA